MRAKALTDESWQDSTSWPQFDLRIGAVFVLWMHGVGDIPSSAVCLTIGIVVLEFRDQTFFVDEVPIVCHSGFLPENGMATDNTLYWWVESLAR